MAVTNVANGVDSLAKQMEMLTSEILSDLVAPLEVYTKAW